MNTTHRFRLSLVLLAAALASPLVADEQRVRAPGPAAARAAVDLNVADRKTLAAVPGIGPELADRIVAARPFTSLDDLDRVKGLTAEQLEQIRAVATVTPPPQRKRLGEPASDKTPPGGAAKSRAPQGDARAPAKLDVNRASESELAAAPAIGPELARALVAARPFTSLDDLSRVKGITAEQLEQVRAQLAVSR